ncbi:hypothetical protein BGZ63DRAFT_10636 [Mariannaea sp. PMI_226]|nr:hypothetical protein BGZ63DRAFT_10636 [Mariannaea sp. PMI_226]
MHRALSARWLNRALSVGEVSASASVPLFLCPAVGASAARWTRIPLAAPPRPSLGSSRRLNHTEATTHDATVRETTSSSPLPEGNVATPEDVQPNRSLPLNCTGCGAFVQTTDPQQLGYFDLNSKRVKKWLDPPTEISHKGSTEDGVLDEVLKSMDPTRLQELGLDPNLLKVGSETEGAALAARIPEKQPVCDRCHNLQHYSISSDTAKLPMFHPTVESLRETIEESPHKYNHIYHVIDAADFPMSLIPRLNVLLGDIPLRTRNRRSRAGKFQKDRRTELSFIITRSDLLAPKKEMVDTMMPYLREVLRNSLGRLGGRVRLGNVKCVSAKRAWWTKDLKEEIWKRGGAGWMVGKVNVGKSQLFEAVFPKGRMGNYQDVNTSTSRSSASSSSSSSGATDAEPIVEEESSESDQWEDVDIGDLLPPAQPAKNYPDMPVVSSLPGTTASPIRIPFGNHKGELIDLPGLARSDLDLFVKEEHRQSMIMKKRIVPEQISLLPGKSLILGGGLIRITPKTQNLNILAYNFTPLEEHLTQTEKAIDFQNQTRHSTGVPSIMLDGIGDKMKHAGTFTLSHDVTKKRAGPLTRKNAVGLQAENLPFRVLSTDILIEGVGYVELVAQVRARDINQHQPTVRRVSRTIGSQDHQEKKKKSSDPFAALYENRRDTKEVFVEEVVEEPAEPAEPGWPAVDIFSPEGQFIGSREPIQGWLNNKPRVLAKHKKSRPRRSMKGQKRKDKMERRAD